MWAQKNKREREREEGVRAEEVGGGGEEFLPSPELGRKKRLSDWFGNFTPLNSCLILHFIIRFHQSVKTLFISFPRRANNKFIIDGEKKMPRTISAVLAQRMRIKGAAG